MRIVSLAPSNTEIIYALGAQDQLIGVTRFCDFPADAKNKPRVAGWTDVDVAKIAALKPDLALTSTVVQAEIAKKLKDAGVPVIHLNPITLEDVLESFLKIGNAVNRGTAARELIIKTDEALAKLVKGVNLNKKIYVEEWHQPPTASGNWVTDLLRLVGVTPILKPGELSRTIATEDVKRYDPDGIVIAWCGMGTKADANQLLQRDGWPELNAVQKNNVFVMDDSLLNRPSPRLVEGLRVIIEAAQRCV